MTKEAEQNYLAMIGDGGREHSLRKPFSDAQCGLNLASIGAIISLLPSPPARLLDMGCGGGWTSVFFARYGFEVVGQDIAQDMIDLAHDNRTLNGLTANPQFIRSDYESLAFQAEFDCAVFFDSLHHAEDELGAIRSAYDALKPGGVLLTHEPGQGHSTAPGSLEAMRLYGVSERDMPPHLIMQRGREVGFRHFRVMPMPADLNTLFYGRPPPPRLSRAGWRHAKKALRMAFHPSHRASSIVMMTK